jgi:hypothetical protein
MRRLDFSLRNPSSAHLLLDPMATPACELIELLRFCSTKIENYFNRCSIDQELVARSESARDNSSGDTFVYLTFTAARQRNQPWEQVGNSFLNELADPSPTEAS